MIYLDNAATTKPCDAAVESVHKTLTTDYMNPSAAYARPLSAQLSSVRAQLCALTEAHQCIFTSGGTEADSLALLGTAQGQQPGRALLFVGEHPACHNTAPQIASMGLSVERVPATRTGHVDLAAFSKMLDDDVRLVACQQISNETGAVQPIAEIATLLRERASNARLMVDGVQGFLRMPFPMKTLGVDLYTVSSHKVHGPKGVGALLLGERARIVPRVLGGSQENSLRAGTENTAGILGFAAALDWMNTQSVNIARLRILKERFCRIILEKQSDVHWNGPNPFHANSAPHIVSFSLPGLRGEVLQSALGHIGIYVGRGSACSDGNRHAPPIFAAMGAPHWAHSNAIRVSLGLMNTMDEIEEAAVKLLRCYQTYAISRGNHA